MKLHYCFDSEMLQGLVLDKEILLKKESNKTLYELSIAGLPFKLKSSHDEQTVQQLVEFVDQKVKEALQATKSGSFQSAAILAALNIAEELILLKKRAIKELDRLEDKAQKLSQNLENSKVKPKDN